MPESETLNSPLRVGIQAGIDILDFNRADIGIASKGISPYPSSITLALHDDENEEHQVGIMINENGHSIGLFAPASENDLDKYFRVMPD